MRRNAWKLVIAGLSAVWAVDAAAQSIIEVEEISATASLEEVELDRTGVSVVVIDQDELDALGETRVSDVLQRVAGVTVRSQGPVGTQTGLVIRGAGQNYVPVFVDGIEVTDPSGPQVAYDFAGLTSGDIGRIEVLKGSQSAIYGSRAVGGVVSITTRRALELGTTYSVDLEYGSYGSAAGSFSVATKS